MEEREEEDTTNSNRRVVIYNVVDDYPSSRDEAVHFAANLLGYENEDNIGNNKLNSKDTHRTEVKSESRTGSSSAKYYHLHRRLYRLYSSLRLKKD